MSQTVSVAQATHDEVVVPERVQEALGQLVGAAKEGLLALSVEVGLGVLRELLEEEVDELVGPKGEARPGPGHGPARSRARGGGAGRPARRGHAAAGQDCGRRVGGAATDLRALRRPRLVGGGRAGADAGRRLDPPVRPGAGAGRRAGRVRGAVDVEVGGVQDVRAADPPAAVAADEPAAGGSPSGGDHARRTSLHGYTNIVALGITTEGEKLALGLWGGSSERHGGRRAAVRSGRPGRRRRAGTAYLSGRPLSSGVDGVWF